MNQTLHTHIQYLEQRIRRLTELASQRHQTEEDRHRIQFELLITEEALAHYRKGFELEQHLPRPLPPDSPPQTASP